MKAAQINSYGDVSKIEINEVAKPEPGEGQVRVRVHAAALNPFDNMVLGGMVVPADQTTFPLTLGQDFAGEVEELGPNVTDFATGDHVYGSSNALFGGSGAFAEYVIANTSSIAASPTVGTQGEIASLPTAGVSALQAIDTLDLSQGQTIFIDGGAGGVGSYAIQIAKDRGLKVTALASTHNQAYVTGLGADTVIDYKTTNYLDAVKDVDGLIHTARALDGNDMLAVLKPGGKAVALTGDLDDAAAAKLGVTVTNQMTHTTTQQLVTLAALVSAGKVTSHVDSQFSLDDTAKAYDVLANGSVAGKIAITPTNDTDSKA